MSVVLGLSLVFLFLSLVSDHRLRRGFRQLSLSRSKQMSDTLSESDFHAQEQFTDLEPDGGSASDRLQVGDVQTSMMGEMQTSMAGDAVQTQAQQACDLSVSSHLPAALPEQKLPSRQARPNMSLPVGISLSTRQHVAEETEPLETLSQEQPAAQQRSPQLWPPSLLLDEQIRTFSRMQSTDCTRLPITYQPGCDWSHFGGEVDFTFDFICCLLFVFIPCLPVPQCLHLLYTFASSSYCSFPPPHVSLCGFFCRITAS